MATITGIELGPNSCLLAGVRSFHRGGGELVSLHRIDETEWPAGRPALEETLRTIRRRYRFPRPASVVTWNLPDDERSAAFARDVTDALASAGFRIVSTITPPQALARLAAARRRMPSGQAVAWLALNTHAAAIAIVRDGDLLYSRTLPWKYTPDQPTSRAQLLQRYTLIAHLAPELVHGMDAVRDQHGLSVETVVTCGNLPELRSLTMPLIEELDREVETLDSLEGLEVAANGRSDRSSELAPALRLATAAALAESAIAEPRWLLPPVARIAAAAAVVATLAWAAYAYWSVSPSRPGSAQSTSRTGADRTSPLPAPAQPPTVTESAGPQSPPVVDANARPVATQGSRGSAQPQRASADGTRPRPQTMVGSVELPRESPRPAAVGRERAVGSSAGKPASAAAVASPQPRSVQRAPAIRQNRDAAGSRQPAVLNEPLPRIDTVLIDQDRRLALVAGSVVGVGDSIGSRVIVGIEQDVVVMREPSGRIVRVRVRS